MHVQGLMSAPLALLQEGSQDLQECMQQEQHLWHELKGSIYGLVSPLVVPLV